MLPLKSVDKLFPRSSGLCPLQKSKSDDMVEKEPFSGKYCFGAFFLCDEIRAGIGNLPLMHPYEPRFRAQAPLAKRKTIETGSII